MSTQECKYCFVEIKLQISFNFYYFFFFLHSWLCVIDFFPLLLDFVLIVAKATKFEQGYHILNQLFFI